MTNSDSLDDSPNSTEFRRLKSVTVVEDVEFELVSDNNSHYLHPPDDSSKLPSFFLPFFNTNLLNLSSTRLLAFCNV